MRIIIRRPHAYLLRREYKTKFAIPGILLLDANKEVLWHGDLKQFDSYKEEPKIPSTPEGKKTSFIFHDIDQTIKVTHNSYSGKTLILNFFASWCPPCQKEIPHLNSFQNHVDKNTKDIQVMGILLDEDLDKAKKYLSKKSFSYPVFLPDKTMIRDGSIEMAGIGKVRGIPLTVVVNQKRQVVKILTGVVTEQQLKKTLQALSSGKTSPDSLAKKTLKNAKTVKLKVMGMMKTKGAT